MTGKFQSVWKLLESDTSIPFDSRSKPSLGTASRKQSGRRPLKILLRIVCHFTSERSRGERGRRTSERRRRPLLEASEDEPRRFRLGVTLWLTLRFHTAPCPFPAPFSPKSPTPPPFRLRSPSSSAFHFFFFFPVLLSPFRPTPIGAPKVTVLQCLDQPDVEIVRDVAHEFQGPNENESVALKRC